jgi:hypothetical protein
VAARSEGEEALMEGGVMSERVDEIKARRAKITSPPWRYDDEHSAVIECGSGGDEWIVQSWSKQEESFVNERENGEFIAHTPADIDFLLAEVTRYRNMIARLCRNLDEHIITSQRAAEQCLKNVQPMQDAVNSVMEARILLGENLSTAVGGR